MESDKSPHLGPEDQELARSTDFALLQKSVAMNSYYRRYRDHISNLPLHEKIKFLKKVMKEDYGISNKNH